MAGIRTSTSRRFEILDTVVRLHVETGQPVPSSMVARSLGGALSPATIRAVMLALEREGYLAQPHTSAGRVPTVEGYRACVDRFLAQWRFRGWETPATLRRRVEGELARTAGTPVIGKALAALLNELTASLGIILGPAWDGLRALRCDLYPREGRRILMVLLLENALVRSAVVTTGRAYQPAVVEEAARLLSERIAGRAVTEIRTRVLPSLDATASAAAGCALDVVARGRELFDDLETGDVELRGVSRLLQEPEFSEPEPLRSLVRLLESPQLIADALRRLCPEPGGLAVWIGAENPIDALRPFGMLSASFSLSGRRGILAVLGPRRMPYPRAVAGLAVVLDGLKRIA